MKLQLHTTSRYLRRTITPAEIHPDELMLPCLDRLARNRINCYHLLSGLHNGPKLPERMSHLVEESHRRGVKVVGGFRPVGAQQGDRSTFPCYCNEEHMQLVLGHFRQYIKAGCDFIYFMADDYYRDKYAGHCKKCIAQFGDLAGEQVYMLHRIVDLAHELGTPNEQILFCPTHYDARSPNDVAYLKAFNDDPKLKGIQFTLTYLTEDVIEERKQALPNHRNEDVTLPQEFLKTLPDRFQLAKILHVRLKKGYEAYCNSVAQDYIPPTQDFHARLGIEDIEKYIAKIEHVVEVRGLLGDGKSRTTPSPRYAGVIFPAARPDEFFISDGCRGGNLTGCLADLWKYHTGEDRWDQSEIPPGMMSPRCGHSAVTVGKKVFCFGGTSNSFTDVRNSLHVFNIENGTVGEITGAQGGPPPERLVHAACVDDRGRMWVFGGLTTGRKALGDLWCYHTDENRWEEINDTKGDQPGPRYGTRLACVGDALYMFGGSRERGPVLGDMYRFEPARRQWTQLETKSGKRPSPRYAPAFVAVGKRVYLFGGGDGRGHYLNDLHVYDPAADRWEQIEPTGKVPGPRGCALPLSPDGKRIYLFSGAQQAAKYGTWINGDLHVYDIAKNEFAKLYSGVSW